MRTVGVVGAGMLGAAVALRLLDVGFGVIAYNRTAAKLDRIVEHGGRAACTPAEVARQADVVITAVRDAAAVKAVSFGDGGIVEGVGGDLVVCDMSTILPAESRNISMAFLRRGIKWLDTPVMGGPDAATAGRLVVMASGDRAAYDSILDILQAVSEKQFHLGSAGYAHSVKLAMNLQIAMLALSISEGICLTRHLGIDPETFLDVLNSTYFGTGMSRKKAYRMVQNQYPATFTLANLTKDLETMRGAATGMTLSMLNEAHRLYAEAVGAGFGDLDYTGILEYICNECGKNDKFPNKPHNTS